MRLSSAMSSAKHRAASRLEWREAHEPDRLWHVVINRFHSTLHQVGFVSEASAPGVSEEFLHNEFIPVVLTREQATLISVNTA
jgi:trehalose utilization protein